MATAVLLLGGNLGPVAQNLHKAALQIAEHIGRISNASQIYSSKSWGFDSPHPFLNQALIVETALTPEELLSATLQIESNLGRCRSTEAAGELNITTPLNLTAPALPTPSLVPQGPNQPLLPPKIYHSRTLDIDLIFYDQAVINTPRLQIPHPLMHVRSFVLNPLVEIIPNYRHPIFKKTIEELATAIMAVTETPADL